MMRRVLLSREEIARRRTENLTRLREVESKGLNAMIKRRDSLILRRTMEEAKMLRLRKRAQREAVKEGFQEFMRNKIADFKRRGLRTDALEKQLAKADQIAEMIMKRPSAADSRSSQLSNAVQGSLRATATASFLSIWLADTDSISRQTHAASAGGFGMWSVYPIRSYWESRGGIRAMQDYYDREISRLNKRIKSVKR